MIATSDVRDCSDNSQLNSRESTVLNVRRKGTSNPGIGFNLDVRSPTANARVIDIVGKLNAQDRTEVVAPGFELELRRP